VNPSARRGLGHRSVAGLPARLALQLIRGYQSSISPGLGPGCRYLPTCSDYGLQAIGRYGLLRGGAMTVWRLLRCNPLCSPGGAGGYDPPFDESAQAGPPARWPVFHVKLPPGTSG
jgi:hypothetical protein